MQYFKENEINVIWQKFKVSEYKKLYKNFEENLSILDFLMINDLDIDLFINSNFN